MTTESGVLSGLSKGAPHGPMGPLKHKRVVEPISPLRPDNGALRSARILRHGDRSPMSSVERGKLAGYRRQLPSQSKTGGSGTSPNGTAAW